MPQLKYPKVPSACGAILVGFSLSIVILHLFEVSSEGTDDIIDLHFPCSNFVVKGSQNDLPVIVASEGTDDIHFPFSNFVVEGSQNDSPVIVASEGIDDIHFPCSNFVVKGSQKDSPLIVDTHFAPSKDIVAVSQGFGRVASIFPHPNGNHPQSEYKGAIAIYGMCENCFVRWGGRKLRGRDRGGSLRRGKVSIGRVNPVHVDLIVTHGLQVGWVYTKMSQFGHVGATLPDSL